MTAYTIPFRVSYYAKALYGKRKRPHRFFSQAGTPNAGTASSLRLADTPIRPNAGTSS